MQKSYHAFGIKILEDDFNLLINTLKFNASNYTGPIKEDADKLVHKIETYGRCKEEDGRIVFDLRFFANEGEMLLWQFMALAIHFKDIITPNKNIPNKTEGDVLS